MAASPGYTDKPIAGSALLTTGDTSRTAPSGGGSAIFSPGAAGGMCERINITPVATIVASVVRIFRYNGSTADLLLEVGIPAQTLSGGTPVQDIVLSAVDFPSRFPIAVPANATPWTLRATVNDTQTGLKVSAEGGSF